MPSLLDCPFESGLNPAAETVQRASVDWAVKTGTIRTSDRKSLEGAQLGVLVSRAFQTAPADRLQIAADWTTLFCCIDDVIEGIRDRGGSGVASHLDALLRSFSWRTADPPVQFSSALVDLRRRLDAVASPAWLSRFSMSLRELFSAWKLEATNRGRNIRPSVATYLKRRSTTIGLDPQFLLAELAEGIWLTEPHEPVLERMKDCTRNCVAWANDLFTYEKEILSGEFHNLVLLLAEARSLSLADASSQVASLHNREMQSFLRLEEQLRRRSAPDRDPDTWRFVEILKSSIRGHLDWGHDNGRYGWIAPVSASTLTVGPDGLTVTDQMRWLLVSGRRKLTL
jgi:hypothetical protein